MERAAVVLCLAASVAVADPTVQPAQPVAGAKNSNIALALSAGTTVLGGGLLLTAAALGQQESDFKKNPALLGFMSTGIVAVLVGPTLGHVYAGDTWNRWLRLRLVGAGAIATGGLLAAAAGGGDACGFPGTSCSGLQTAGFGLGVLLIAGGAVGYVVGTSAEIGSAPRAAARHNRQLAVTPLATSNALGIALSWSL